MKKTFLKRNVFLILHFRFLFRILWIFEKSFHIIKISFYQKQMDIFWIENDTWRSSGYPLIPSCFQHASANLFLVAPVRLLFLFVKHFLFKQCQMEKPCSELWQRRVKSCETFPRFIISQLFPASSPSPFWRFHVFREESIVLNDSGIVIQRSHTKLHIKWKIHKHLILFSKLKNWMNK